VINHTESLTVIIDKPRLIFNGHNYVDKNRRLAGQLPRLYR
jgi:hypothetical protein